MPARRELKTYEQFTDKERLAVDGYCNPDSPTRQNKVRSYEAAGYYVAGPPEGEEDDGRGYNAAKVKAFQLFKKPHLAAEVERRQRIELDVLKMPIEEAVARVSKMASADLMEYLVEVPHQCPHCEGELEMGVEYVFDIKRMRKDGYGSLLKGMVPTKFGTKFDFYPADAALERMMKFHGGFNDKASTNNTYVDKLLILAKEE